MKIAIIITGELRIPNFNNFFNSIKNYDIYISTYNEYEYIANKISKNYIITNRKNKCFNKKNIPYSNIYQWWHLNKVLKKYKKKLMNYDIIFKTRSDTYFIEPLTDKHFSNIDKECFYINSDFSFYGSSIIFYNIYKNFYNDILNKYLNNGNKYFNINYNNLVLSYKNTNKKSKYNIYKKKYNNIRNDINIGLKELVYPSSVYSKNKKILIKNIIFYLDNNLKIDNNTYKNLNKSVNKNFGSEIYNSQNLHHN